MSYQSPWNGSWMSYQGPWTGSWVMMCYQGPWTGNWRWRWWATRLLSLGECWALHAATTFSLVADGIHRRADGRRRWTTVRRAEPLWRCGARSGTDVRRRWSHSGSPRSRWPPRCRHIVFRLTTSVLGAEHALMSGRNDAAATALRSWSRVSSACCRAQSWLTYQTANIGCRICQKVPDLGASGTEAKSPQIADYL